MSERKTDKARTKPRRPATQEVRYGDRDEVKAWLDERRAEVIAAGGRLKRCDLSPRGGSDIWVGNIVYRHARRANGGTA